MLIDKIETIRIPEHPNLIWVKIYNNDGLFGLGETWFGAEAVEADIHSRLAPLLIGQDPTKIEFTDATLPLNSSGVFNCNIV